MTAPKAPRLAKEAADELAVARLRLSQAEAAVATAKDQARLAKRRRKEAKEAARRSKKLLKQAKADLVEAREAVEQLETKLARPAPPSRVVKKRATKPSAAAAESPSPAPPGDAENPPSVGTTEETQGSQAPNGAQTP